MRGINVSDDFVSQILGKPVAKLSESSVVEETVNEETAEDVHVCPLCESHLEEEISQEKIDEHINFFLSVINENFDFAGDDLDESELEESNEVDQDEDEDAEDVDEMCGPKGKKEKKMPAFLKKKK
jgi:hypothetical protein